jgi:hypothetical protein
MDQPTSSRCCASILSPEVIGSFRSGPAGTNVNSAATPRRLRALGKRECQSMKEARVSVPGTIGKLWWKKKKASLMVRVARSLARLPKLAILGGSLALVQSVRQARKRQSHA